MDHGARVDLCLANSAPVGEGLVERYRAEDAAPLVVDRERWPPRGATTPATTRISWPRRCWSSTASGPCAFSGARTAIS